MCGLTDHKMEIHTWHNHRPLLNIRRDNCRATANTKRSVILSDRRESKDLRTNLPPALPVVRRSFDFGLRPALRMTNWRAGPSDLHVIAACPDAFGIGGRFVNRPYGFDFTIFDRGRNAGTAFPMDAVLANKKRAAFSGAFFSYPISPTARRGRRPSRAARPERRRHRAYPPCR